jgi:hypothetical protein
MCDVHQRTTQQTESEEKLSLEARAEAPLTLALAAKR